MSRQKEGHGEALDHRPALPITSQDETAPYLVVVTRTPAVMDDRYIVELEGRPLRFIGMC
jgi:hypothetical protein